MEKVKSRSAKKITETVKKIVGLKAAAARAETRKPAAGVHNDDFFRRVQDKAYQIYADRGYTHGDDLADWYVAERFVRSQMKAAR